MASKVRRMSSRSEDQSRRRKGHPRNCRPQPRPGTHFSAYLTKNLRSPNRCLGRARIIRARMSGICWWLTTRSAFSAAGRSSPVSTRRVPTTTRLATTHPPHQVSAHHRLTRRNAGRENGTRIRLRVCTQLNRRRVTKPNTTIGTARTRRRTWATGPAVSTSGSRGMATFSTAQAGLGLPAAQAHPIQAMRRSLS